MVKVHGRQASESPSQQISLYLPAIPRKAAAMTTNITSLHAGNVHAHPAPLRRGSLKNQRADEDLLKVCGPAPKHFQTKQHLSRRWMTLTTCMENGLKMLTIHDKRPLTHIHGLLDKVKDVNIMPVDLTSRNNQKESILRISQKRFHGSRQASRFAFHAMWL